MARLRSSGIDILEDDLRNLERDLRAKIIPEMLHAGADVLVQSWQNQISTHRYIKTGQMLESVSSTDVRYDKDGASIEVYPQGTDSHRVTNAQKAYVLNYGRAPTRKGTKKITGSKFVKAAETDAAAKVDAAMQAVLDKYTSKKG